jgi:hypothetical protein
MEDMSWVADTGRCHEFVADPQNTKEAEFIGNGGCARAAEMGFYIVPAGKIATK